MPKNEHKPHEHEAKRDIGSKLLQSIREMKAGKRARVAPPGGMEGEVWIADDFDAPLDELFDCLKDDRSEGGK